MSDRTQLGLWRSLCSCPRPITQVDLDDGDVSCVLCGRPTDRLGPIVSTEQRQPTYNDGGTGR